MPRRKQTGTGFARPLGLRAWSARPHGSCPLCSGRVALIGAVMCQHTDTLTSEVCAGSGLTVERAQLSKGAKAS